MAFILKEGKTVLDPTNGEISTAYVITKYFGGTNETSENDRRFDFWMYKRKEDKINDRAAIGQESISFTQEEWETINAPVTEAERVHTVNGEQVVRTPMDVVFHRVYSLTPSKVVEYVDEYNDIVHEPIKLFGIPVTDWESDE